MIVACKRVSKPFWHSRASPFLPHRDNYELVALGPTHIHEVRPLEVSDEHGSPLTWLDSRRSMRPGHPRGHLGLLLESPAHTLSKARCGVVGDRYEHCATGSAWGKTGWSRGRSAAGR